MQPNLKLQNEIWSYILSYYEDYGYSPLRREIANALSKEGRVISPQLVQYHLWNLKKRGKIHFNPLRKRNILIGRLSTK
jgi:SOS-response transcriptional repressor LexA